MACWLSKRPTGVVLLAKAAFVAAMTCSISVANLCMACTAFAVPCSATALLLLSVFGTVLPDAFYRCMARALLAGAVFENVRTAGVNSGRMP